jgi:hypothetical protein
VKCVRTNDDDNEPCDRCKRLQLDCLPHVSRQGQGPRRSRKKQKTSASSSVASSDDDRVLEKLTATTAATTTAATKSPTTRTVSLSGRGGPPPISLTTTGTSAYANIPMLDTFKSSNPVSALSSLASLLNPTPMPEQNSLVAASTGNSNFNNNNRNNVNDIIGAIVGNHGNNNGSGFGTMNRVMNTMNNNRLTSSTKKMNRLKGGNTIDNNNENGNATNNNHNNNNNDDDTKKPVAKQETLQVEDEFVSNSINGMDFNHYGLHHQIRQWISLSFTRRSLNLLARASFIASRCGMTMDDVLSNKSPFAAVTNSQPMTFVSVNILYPREQQSTLGPRVNLLELPVDLLKAIHIDPRIGQTYANRWSQIRWNSKGTCRFWGTSNCYFAVLSSNEAIIYFPRRKIELFLY